MHEPPMREPVLEVCNLSVRYIDGAVDVPAASDVSFSVAPGEILGIAGESGSGKSTLAMASTRLLEPSVAEVEGRVVIAGRDIFGADPEALRNMRWTTFAVVFQSAMNALNPVMRVSDQMARVARAHTDWGTEKIRARMTEVMEKMGIPRDRLGAYPHELSGGMRQRVMIALALLLEPRLVVMDEPTTALDVVVQGEIVREIRRLQAGSDFAMVLVTHDIALLSELAHRILVMYAGRVVEAGSTEEITGAPLHPYTRGLLASFPTVSGARTHLTGIEGDPPDMTRIPAGCPFHPRCRHARDECREERPELRTFGPARQAACHLLDDQGRLEESCAEASR